MIYTATDATQQAQHITGAQLKLRTLSNTGDYVDPGSPMPIAVHTAKSAPGQMSNIDARGRPRASIDNETTGRTPCGIAFRELRRS